MHALIQGVIFGVLTGGVYALMASGQTLIFGIMKVVNLAQGAMVILGRLPGVPAVHLVRHRPVPGDPDDHRAHVRRRRRRAGGRSCGRCAARTGPS